MDDQTDVFKNEQKMNAFHKTTALVYTQIGAPLSLLRENGNINFRLLFFVRQMKGGNGDYNNKGDFPCWVAF